MDIYMECVVTTAIDSAPWSTTHNDKWITNSHENRMNT